MKNLNRIITLIFVTFLSFLKLNAQTYYIDQVAGNDANNGLTISSPWQNLTKINNLTLGPGSVVYLKSGSVWTGQQLKFNGSGNATSSIIINSYGTGNKPIINGNGLTGQGVVYLYNQQYIEINNLEITNSPVGPVNSIFFIGINDGTTNHNPYGADRRGVMVAIDNFGTASHIYLKNLNIHHVKGQLGSGTSSVNGAIPKRTGGIYFTVLGNNESSSSKSRFHDVLIDSCNINYCENIGIAFDNEWNTYYPGGQYSSVSADRIEYTNWYNRRFSNVKVSNNVIHHIGKNAMIIRCTDSTGLIERNVCYETALGTTGNTMFTARAKGTVFQYNEGYYNRATTQNIDPGNIDGSMYDPDFGSVGVIFQYSYSHDNSHGIYWGCNSRSSSLSVPDPGDSACTLRYCISQNDNGDLVYFNYPSAGNHIYNNVFYIKSGISPNIIHENGTNDHKYDFYNNIIYNLSSTSSGASYAFGSGNGVQTMLFSNNVFYGNHPSSEPSDPAKLTSNPNFVSPGTASTGLYTTTGYKLNYGSPSLHNGKVITNNGGLDFFGNTVPVSSSPNRGCYEGAGIGAPVTNPPVIISFTPTTSGTGGTVTITGHYLTGATSVTFGGTAAASYTVVNDSTIIAVVANGSTGVITVVTPQGSTTSSNIFTFCTPPAAPRANGITICKGATATLTATGSGSLSWFNAPAGGVRLANGANFTTPVLNTATTYYVQDSTCSVSSTRTPVTVSLFNSTNSSSTATSCNSYVWNGTTYTASGAYTRNYTNGNGCPSVDTLFLTITNRVLPSFNQVAPICVNGSFTLPTTSTNGISGTWSPAPNNQQTTTYTFTPTAGQCATTATMTVTVNTVPTAPTFNQVAPICINGSFTLPNTSLQGVIGSWSPAINNQQTTTYTFTPTSGQCATTTTMTVQVTPPQIVPTFSPIAAICRNGTISLPATSLQGITGTWSPSPNNQQTTTYTFTPDPGQCALQTTITVAVKENSPLSDTTIIASSPIVWQGITYSTSGVYTWIGTNSIGCDSIIKLNLTIKSTSLVFPNPTQGVLNINLQALDYSLTDDDIIRKNVTMTLYDITGKKILSQALNQINSVIEINSIRKLSSGVYIIKIQSSDESINSSTKILKQ